MLKKLAAVSAITLLVAGGGAIAQSLSLAPTFGSTTLTAGFANDPRAVSLVAGGSIAASALQSQTSSSCTGYIANAPDYSVTYTPGSFPLIFSVYADADTTLVVNGPNGLWYCNDDTNGVNPAVRFDAPTAGRYDVWVGTFSSGPTAPATLFVSELRAGTATDVPAAGGSTTGGGSTSSSDLLDPSLPANYGNVSLNAGFVPDPHLVTLQAGGTTSAATGTNGASGCTGVVTRAPDYQLTYTAGSWPLYISVSSSADTTLVVNLPNGQWSCDDDSGGNLNPKLSYATPMSGVYDIWVGTFQSGSAQPATLRISETN